MRKRILAIDDSPHVLLAHSDLLTRRGYTVAVADNAEDGLHKLTTFAPDLVLLDINMPEIDGWGFLERAHDRGKLKGTPVIIFSGVPLPEEKTEALDGTQVSYLAKSVSGSDLVRRIEEVLQGEGPQTE